MSPLPIGVVGVGALGIHHARHLARISEVDLVGFYDISESRTREVEAAVGVPGFPSLEALLARVRAVTIAVPTVSHAEVGLAAIARGVPVLLEKPLARTLEEADALVAAAGARGLQLQVGHIERFNAALRAAERYLERATFIEGWRLAPFQVRGTDVPVVLDLMIHDLDLILHLTGGSEAVDVRAVGETVLSSHLDVVHTRVEFGSGPVASVTASRIARERVRRLKVYQPGGCLLLDLGAGCGEFITLREGWHPESRGRLEDVIDRIPLEAPRADALQLELLSFIHAVRGEREAVVTGHEGRAALALALEVTAAVERTGLASHAIP
jgi:predicted dehydrogenase